MKLMILQLRDIKADQFLPPWFVPNLAVAMRDLTEALNSDSKEPWVRHPHDFELYDTGVYDTDDGSFYTPAEGRNIDRRQVCVLSSLKG